MKRFVHAVAGAAGAVVIAMTLSAGVGSTQAGSGYIQEIGPSGYIQEVVSPGYIQE